MTDGVLDTNREAEIENFSATAQKEDRKVAAHFQETFGSDSGKVVLKKLENFCFMNSSTFSPDSRDTVIFREGMRNVALWIHTWLNYERDLLK